MIFNLKRYKLAQMRGHYPPSTLPDEDERYFRLRKDPYRVDRKPGDGEGNKLTTPGSVGMLGDNPDPGFLAGGNERTGYPDGTSQYEDPGDKEKRREVPYDNDPENPFTGQSRREGEGEYGQGQGTDYGQAQHDDAMVHTDQSADAPLGIRDTVERDMDINNRDYKTPVSNMQKPRENTFNRRISKIGPMDYVRSIQSR